jgi:alanyl aminopeptidase
MRIPRLSPFAALAAALIACSAAPPPDAPPPATPAPRAALPPEAPPAGRLPADVAPQRYALSLQVVPERERFAGTVEIALRLTRERDVIWLHGQDLRVTEASVQPEGGERAPARWESINAEGLAAVRLTRPIGPGVVTLRLAFDAPFNAGLQGHFHVTADGRQYAFTKFEPMSARLAFPCLDEPGYKTPFELTLTVPEGLTALGNTRVIDQADLPDGLRRVRFAPTENLPTYLVAWAVGPFDVVDATLPPTSIRERPLPLRGIAARGRGAELAYAMTHARGWLESLEGYFGMEYPYDKLDLIAAPDYPSGAMENAGAIMFREPSLLLHEKTASENQRRNLAITVAHEVAHQWFGNLVTMAWWDDLWLNEAFAEWMGFRVIHELSPGYRLDVELLHDIHGAMSADSLASARQIRQPILTNHDIRNAFDGITYVKGAAVLTMFERWIGPDAFQRGIRAHLAGHRGGNATADDLLSALSAAAGRDVATPFRSFLMQSGLPTIEARVRCEGGAGHLALRQSRYLPAGSTGERDRTWQLPVCARYEARSEVRTACTLLTEREGRMELPGPSCPSWVLPNADGAGYYRWSMPPADLARLRKAGYSRLGALDRLAFADSVRAGFDDGTVPAADVFAALSPLVTDESRHVSTAPMSLLRFARTRIADDALRPRVEAFARKLYAPLMGKLGWAPRPGAQEDGETALLRSEVVAFLAHAGRDPAVRREAALRGRSYIGFGGDGRLHADAVAGDLAGVALAIAVQDGDAAVFDAVLALLRATRDAPVRGSMLRALASTHDPTLAAKVHALMLDPGVRGSEIFPLLGTRMADPATREPAWQWYREHFDAVTARLAAQHGQYAANVGQSYCDAAHADEVRAFFEPRMGAFVGGPRNLTAVLESIRLCAARVTAQGESTRAFFQGAARR